MFYPLAPNLAWMQCDMGSKKGGEGDTVILLGSSRKMKDDVRLIFSLIRQQTEMEGREQEVGGWVPHCSPDCQEGKRAGPREPQLERKDLPQSSLGAQVLKFIALWSGRQENTLTYLFVHPYPSLSQ